MSETNDLIDALTPVVNALRRLDVPHYVGSIASSFHGATRTTMDVDLVCELQASQVTSFVEFFDQDFYISESAVRDAVFRKSCCNIIHTTTSYKIDLFISRRRPFDVEAMRRAPLEALGDDRRVEVPIATAEDSILSKLECYRLTNETSERQWEDVSRLIKLLGDTADVDYLENWAKSVGVSDLLSRLLAQE